MGVMCRSLSARFAAPLTVEMNEVSGIQAIDSAGNTREVTQKITVYLTLGTPVRIYHGRFL